jgi:TolB-like protein/class 3 adenylate cyclase/Tfp pilus assembly protein PilF
MANPEQGRPPRRLAAILAADVAGYSRLMGADETGTALALREHWAAIDPVVKGHGGRIVKTIGDGVLLEFPSIVAAVECAVAVQKLMAERNADVPEDRRMLFRIGINLGDVLIEGDDILGDGVNVAARLEGIAEPGGICLSDSAYQQVRDKMPIEVSDMGEQRLKNIARPVRTYRLRIDGRPQPVKPTLALPDKPSIAVLPFQNMSADPEQDYFADGVVEEIITALSRMRWLFVIARNSTFTYKGRAVDVRQVGRELGVRYVLEGSVRKAANRVRITGQLIDSATGTHLWADRFEGALEDIFDLQDQVTARVVGTLAPKLEQAEIERAKLKPTERLDAYDYYLRGKANIHQLTQQENSDALAMFYRAIELDPNFASAYGMAAWCYVKRKNFGWMTDPVQESAELERLAKKAAALGKEDAVALYTAGFALAQAAGHLEAGAALLDRALTLDPNLADAWHLSGWVRIHLAEPETAIEHMARAMRLNPLDPLLIGMQNGTAAAHFLAGRYDEASAWAEKALREHPTHAPALRMAASSHALAGRLAQAREVMARLLHIEPTLRVSNVAAFVPFRRPQDFERYFEGLRKAGLPE